MINLIDYTDIASNALLLLLDELAQIQRNKLLVKLTKDEKEYLVAKIEELIADEIKFGHMNFIVATCYPANNWRRERSQETPLNKYILNDDSVKIDLHKLDKFLDKTFEKLKATNTINNRYYISNYHIDSCDLSTYLRCKWEFDDIDYTTYNYILDDVNKNLFCHNCQCISEAPGFVLCEVDTLLNSYGFMNLV
jgi:hypothetical protein